MSLEEKEIKDKLFLKGIEAFNNKNFYDAHEHWEELWSDYILKDAKFIQALIQLSVGYFHITNSNKNGAIGLLSKCLPKFELYIPNQRKINVLEIIAIAQKALSCIKNIDKMSEFDWSLTPTINNE